jgi:hypothetical protein
VTSLINASIYSLVERGGFNSTRSPLLWFALTIIVIHTFNANGQESPTPCAMAAAKNGMGTTTIISARNHH